MAGNMINAVPVKSCANAQLDDVFNLPKASDASSVNFVYPKGDVVAYLEMHQNSELLPLMYSTRSFSLRFAFSLLYHDYTSALTDIPTILSKRLDKRMLQDNGRGEVFLSKGLSHRRHVTAGTGPLISFSGKKGGTVYYVAGQSMGISMQYSDNKSKTGYVGRQYQLVDLSGNPIGDYLIHTSVDSDGQWTKATQGKRALPPTNIECRSTTDAFTTDARGASKVRKVTQVNLENNAQSEQTESTSSASTADQPTAGAVSTNAIGALKARQATKVRQVNLENDVQSEQTESTSSASTADQPTAGIFSVGPSGASKAPKVTEVNVFNDAYGGRTSAPLPSTEGLSTAGAISTGAIGASLSREDTNFEWSDAFVDELFSNERLDKYGNLIEVRLGEFASLMSLDQGEPPSDEEFTFISGACEDIGGKWATGSTLERAASA